MIAQLISTDLREWLYTLGVFPLMGLLGLPLYAMMWRSERRRGGDSP